MHYENEEMTTLSEEKRKVAKSPRYTLTLKLKNGVLRTIGIIADSMEEAGQVAYFYSKANNNCNVCISKGFTRQNLN